MPVRIELPEDGDWIMTRRRRKAASTLRAIPAETEFEAMIFRVICG